MIVVGNFNQDIASKEMRDFYSKLQIQDVHQIYNYINIKQLDNTHQNRSKAIDSIAISDNLIEILEGSRLCKVDEILRIDHRRHVIDLNLDQFFEEKTKQWNNID